MASLAGGQNGARAGTAPRQRLWGRETASASLAASPTAGGVTASCAPECSHCSGTSPQILFIATNSLRAFSKRQSHHYQDTAARAEGWQADLCVHALSLKPAERTPKFLRLAYWVRLGATRPGACLKPTGPGRRAPTITVSTPAQTTQVLAPKAGKGPEDETQSAASAQEDTGDADTRDADRVSTLCSLAAEQAADDGAKGAGTSQAMLDVKSSKERASSARRGGRFLPCCHCSSTTSAVLTDEQESQNHRKEEKTLLRETLWQWQPKSQGAHHLVMQRPCLQHVQCLETFSRRWTAGDQGHIQPQQHLRGGERASANLWTIPGCPGIPSQACTHHTQVLQLDIHKASRSHQTRTLPETSRSKAVSTSTEETPAQATQVLATPAGSSPTHQTPPAPSAQEGTRDLVKACMSLQSLSRLRMKYPSHSDAGGNKLHGLLCSLFLSLHSLKLLSSSFYQLKSLERPFS